MDDHFVPFLILVIAPIAYFAYRGGLFTGRFLSWAIGLFLLALTALNLPLDGVGYGFLKKYNLLISSAVVLILLMRYAGVSWFLEQRNFRAALSITALAAVVSYTNFFAFHGGGSWVHFHDVAHYYLGSKYFRELGYRNLYGAMLRAELEEYGNFLTPEARDLSSYHLVPVEVIVDKSGPARDRFTDTRWAEFRTDVAYFRESMGAKYAEVFKDHGYNPTPVWGMIGGFLANSLPPPGKGGVFLVTLIDPLLLALSFSAVAATFGVETALLCLIYFCVSFGAMFAWKGGAFLRELSFAAILFSACGLRCGRHGVAGTMLGIAASLRVYPLLLAVPPFSQAAWNFTRTRNDTRLTSPSFVLGFGVATALLFALTALLVGGLAEWREFLENILGHSQGASANRIGITSWLAYFAELNLHEPGGFEALIARRSVAYHMQIAMVFSAAMLFVCVCTRKLDPVQAMGMGALLVFTGLNLSAYYYTFLVILILAHHDRPNALALIFSVEAVTYGLHLFEEHEVMLYLYKSLLLAYLFIALYFDGMRTELGALAKVVRTRFFQGTV